MIEEEPIIDLHPPIINTKPKEEDTQNKLVLNNPAIKDLRAKSVFFLNGVSITSGATNPTNKTSIGSLFLNTTNGKLYICTATTPTWTVVGSQS